MIEQLKDNIYLKLEEIMTLRDKREITWENYIYNMTYNLGQLELLKNIEKQLDLK